MRASRRLVSQLATASSQRPLASSSPGTPSSSALPKLRSRPQVNLRPIISALRPQRAAFTSTPSHLHEHHSPSDPQSSRPLTTGGDGRAPSSQEPLPEDVPSYQLTFTCKKCATRSSHRITKQGYHGGTVLISCPGCKARHLISDHLKIFSDRPVTVETILAARGEMVTRGVAQPKVVAGEGVREAPAQEGTAARTPEPTSIPDGDIEFWGEPDRPHTREPPLASQGKGGTHHENPGYNTYTDEHGGRSQEARNAEEEKRRAGQQ